MTTSELVLPQPGPALKLARPGTRDPTLRAWDAADELLIEQALAAASGKAPRVLVVDDQYGALTLGLADLSPAVVADNAGLAGALSANARRNPGRVAPARVHSWLSPPDGPFDLVVMRIPRQADYLAWLLRWLNGVLADSGLLLAGGMIKHVPARSVEVFSALVHTEAVLPARKKARVVRCRRGNPQLADWSEAWKGYNEVPGCGQVQALPAVFARDRLDIGSRLLLPHIADVVADVVADGAEAGQVLDLACGNGVLGLAALARRPELAMTFSDVSSQAVISARHNAERAFPAARQAFVHADGVPTVDGTPGAGGPWDLILLNPPFHEGGVVGDHIALRLFDQASRSLAPGGRLLMVGNRHLGYHRSLPRLFRNVRQRDANPKFVVFEANNG